MKICTYVFEHICMYVCNMYLTLCPAHVKHVCKCSALRFHFAASAVSSLYHLFRALLTHNAHTRGNKSACIRSPFITAKTRHRSRNAFTPHKILGIVLNIKHFHSSILSTNFRHLTILLSSLLLLLQLLLLLLLFRLI